MVQRLSPGTTVWLRPTASSGGAGAAGGFVGAGVDRGRGVVGGGGGEPPAEVAPVDASSPVSPCPQHCEGDGFQAEQRDESSVPCSHDVDPLVTVGPIGSL